MRAGIQAQGVWPFRSYLVRHKGEVIAKTSSATVAGVIADLSERLAKEEQRYRCLRGKYNAEIRGRA
jgi:hypothetical protein